MSPGEVSAHSWLIPGKESTVTFEGDMPNMKTDMNNYLLSQKIEKIKRMEYSDQTVKLIAIVIEDLRKNTTERSARFSQRYFLHKGLKILD